MRLIARGYAYKEVGKELFISVKTVETHVSSVLRKLQLSSAESRPGLGPDSRCHRAPLPAGRAAEPAVDRYEPSPAWASATAWEAVVTAVAHRGARLSQPSRRVLAAPISAAPVGGEPSRARDSRSATPVEATVRLQPTASYNVPGYG